VLKTYDKRCHKPQVCFLVLVHWKNKSHITHQQSMTSLEKNCQNKTKKKDIIYLSQFESTFITSSLWVQNGLDLYYTPHILSLHGHDISMFSFQNSLYIYIYIYKEFQLCVSKL